LRAAVDERPKGTRWETPRMDVEDRIQMTGSMILSLVWTLLVSTLLFALVGAG
jgi:hypothetical protein